MNGTRKIHASKKNRTRVLVALAAAIVLSAGLAAAPAFADSGRRHHGWGHGNKHHGYQNGYHNRHPHWGYRGGHAWAYRNWPHGYSQPFAFRHQGYSQPFAFRHQRHPGRHRGAFGHPGWNAFGHPGWTGYRQGHGGGASITLNIPFR